MTDRHIETSLLWLAALSLLLHIVVVALLLRFADKAVPIQTEPTFVDLREMDLPSQPSKPEPPVKRQAERFKRVPKEMAPRTEQDNINEQSAMVRTKPRRQAAPPTSQASRSRGVVVPPPSSQTGQSPMVPGSSAAALVRRKTVEPSLEPSVSRLARMEEAYRKRYADEIAEGKTALLDTDDTVFYSFLRRFENAVYGVWRYPMEAQIKGIEGTTPIRITFRRDGTIDFDRTHLLESSGHRILDEEVLRTLRSLGPLGAFPKGYTKDEFHLIAFFHYGGAKRSLR